MVDIATMLNAGYSTVQYSTSICVQVSCQQLTTNNTN